MFNKIALVQTIGNLESFYELREKNALPLVLKLRKEEVDILKINSSDHSPSSVSVPYFYQSRMDWNDEYDFYTLYENSIEKLLEEYSIYIPEFIDIDGNKRYIDYIVRTYNYINENSKNRDFFSLDFRHRIVFRNRKRLFGLLCTHTDYVPGVYEENPNARVVYDIAKETLKSPEKVERNKEKIKSMLKYH